MSSVWDRNRPSFGFVSTRLAGTDGVSLETRKWVEVIRDRGCSVSFCAGQLDTEEEVSHLAPRAWFGDPAIAEVQDALFRAKERTPAVTRRVHELKEELKTDLETFHRRFGFDILVVQNALAIPVNIPLGLAIMEFIVEQGVPTIAHHHDFFWERQRFLSFAAMDFLRQAFPPVHPLIRHVVINSVAGHELAWRTGASWTLVPNVLDFKSIPPDIDDWTRDFREEIGLPSGARLILQPTRVVSRKGIETAIELVRRLDGPDGSLVITHEAGDEGDGYLKRIEEYAAFLEVNLRIISDRIAEERGVDFQGRKQYRLWDVYPHADLITYPSSYEGYGNAFVEAIYFRRPIVVNRYAIFEADIEPKGFDVVDFLDYITEETIDEVRELLGDRERLTRSAEKNYMLGWRHLSYEVLEEKLQSLLIDIYGS